MKNIVTISFITAFFVSGCVQIEIGNAVSDTVDASKELYQTIKRKRNGEEERKYSHSIPSPDESHDLENIAKCKEQIKQIIDDSGFKLREVLSESSEISFVNESRSIQCSLIVVVRK